MENLGVAVEIAFPSLLYTELLLLPVCRPPSLICDILLLMAISKIAPLSIWTPQTWGWPLKSRCYLVYKPRYTYFRFSGRHLRFPTSSYVGQYRNSTVGKSYPENIGKAVGILL